MSKAIQLTIKEPCHENWQNMNPNEQGRHCLSCQKTVVDFTSMSDKEILAFFTKSSSSVCGRFNNHQLDRDLKEQTKKKRYAFAYAWSVLVATTLMTTSAKAQGNVSLKGKLKVEKINKFEMTPIMMGDVSFPIIERPVTGFVFDAETRGPVYSASVKITGTKYGYATLEDGRFVFEKLNTAKGIQLEISAVGYETQTYPLSRDGVTKDVKIYLRHKAEELAPVEVVGYGPTVGKVSVVSPSLPVKVDTTIRDTTRTIGELVVCYKPTITEKVTRVITNLIPEPISAPFKSNKVKVFPNPQRPGSTLNISLQLKDMGEYKMELMDASGRVVWVQPIQVTAKDQNVTLPTNSAWSTGIYYLRITGHKDKNVYQSKVLLQ